MTQRTSPKQHGVRHWIPLFLLTIGALVLFLGCGEGGQSSEGPLSLDDVLDQEMDEEANSAKLRLLLVDAPADDIDNVWMTVSQISAIPERGSAVTISNETSTFDLLDLRFGLAETLGIASIPSGSYTELRMLVTDASVVVDGETHDLFVPSGSTSGIKLQFPFTVSDNEIATMLIDLDASASIHYSPGSGYIMRPVIHVATFRTEEIDDVAPPAPDVSSSTHPNQNVWSPVDTATFNWTAEDNVGMTGFSYTFDQIPSTIPDNVIERREELAQECAPSEYPAEPVCNVIEPTNALQGGLLNIYGANFGRWASTLTVTIGGDVVEVLQVLPTHLVARVPMGVGAKDVVISTPKGQVTCATQLQVVSDTSFCPDGTYEVGKGLLGEVIEIPDSNHNNSCVLPSAEAYETPHSTVVACKLDVPNTYFSEGFPGVDGTLVEWFAIRWRATFIAPVSGTYEFRVAADDGANLWIDDQLVVNNDGVHAIQSRSGRIYLDAGNHDFRLEYFQGPRWYIALQLYWTVPGQSREIMPKNVFLLPSNTASESEFQPLCYCSGHGAGAYDYRAYAINDGDGKLFTLDLYDEEAQPEELGVLKSPGNRTLSDFESLAILGNQLYGINNDGHNSIKNRLFRILKDEASGAVVPTEEIGQVKHNGSVVRDVDCLAVSPDGEMYGISTHTDTLYSVDLESAALTEVMDVEGEIEGCAFSPSGILYGIDNSGSTAKLVAIDIAGGQQETVAELPYNTDVEALGWHPDGFLYAGIDNSNNSYPPVAKIRPSDGVVVETFDPSIKWNDIEGLDFEYGAEQGTCLCDLDVVTDTSASIQGNVTIRDDNRDGFSEKVVFSGDQMIMAADPATDPLAGYVGVDFTCFKPKSKLEITSLELDPTAAHANRYPFRDGLRTGGFSLSLLQSNCQYVAVATGDLLPDNEYIFSSGHSGSFWMKVTNMSVTNTIGSAFLAALAAQDEPAGLNVSFQIDSHGPSIKHKLDRGETVEGTYSFTMQPGRDIITGDGDTGDLPPCADPSLHTPSLDGAATYHDVADGVWYFHVHAVDDSGNWGETAHYRVKIDSSAPGAPVISSTTHISQEMGYVNPNPEFQWSLSDTSGIEGYSYMVSQEPGSEPNEQVDTASSEYSLHDLEPGSYWLHVKGVNHAGLWGDTSHFKFTVMAPQPDKPTPPLGFAPFPRTIFLMGSPTAQSDRYEDERQHWVEVDNYLLQQKEVTNNEYRACVAAYTETDTACESDAACPANHFCNLDGVCATGCERQPNAQATYWSNKRGDYPVTFVDWNDARKYCVSNGMRLPTEAEWEFAAKGADSDRYPWGDTFEGLRANVIEFGLAAAVAAGSFDGTNDDMGDGTVCIDGRCLYDMAGNVEEWVDDRYHTYPAAASEENPTQFPNVDDETECLSTCNADPTCMANCENRVARGGSFMSTARESRVFFRKAYLPIFKADHIGFRCAMDWDETVIDPEVCDGVDNDDDGEIDEDFDDTDEDGEADCIDEDDDDDGVLDDEDNCPLLANTDQIDLDRDGFGEVCDPDGEQLEITYPGLVRPWDVALDNDGTLYIAGSRDGVAITSQSNNAKGTVMSVAERGYRTGQVMLADNTSANTQSEDYRPNSLHLSSLGYLYTTDNSSGYDDGIWKIVLDDQDNQLGRAQNPEGRNGEAGGTERFWMGDSSTRGIDKTTGTVLDRANNWLYIARGNSKKIFRYTIENDGSVSDDDGKWGEQIVSSNTKLLTPALDPEGDLYFIAQYYLYRVRMRNGHPQSAERLSDNKAFRNVSDMQFDSDGNLLVLHYKGKSNTWPFRGSAQDRVVPAESGYITYLSADVLDHASPSRLITHGDETKQQLIYGGPASREILYENKRLAGPRGFKFGESEHQLVIANTDADEVVELDIAAREMLRVIETGGEFDGLE